MSEKISQMDNYPNASIDDNCYFPTIDANIDPTQNYKANPGQIRAYMNASLGTMSTQDSDAVNITGGAINGTNIGQTTAANGVFTDLVANQIFFGGITYPGLILNNMTTAQRDAALNQLDGALIYNSEQDKLNARLNGSWVEIPADVNSLYDESGFLLVGPGQAYTTISAALQYWDSLGGTAYKIRLTGDTTEASSYTVTNANLEYVSVKNSSGFYHTLGNFNYNFSACINAGSFGLIFSEFSFEYQYTSSKSVFVLPDVDTLFTANSFFELFNYSASPLDCPVIQRIDAAHNVLVQIYGDLLIRETNDVSTIDCTQLSTFGMYFDSTSAVDDVIVANNMTANQVVINSIIGGSPGNPASFFNISRSLQISNLFNRLDYYPTFVCANANIANIVTDNLGGGISISCSDSCSVTNGDLGEDSRITLPNSGEYVLSNLKLGEIALDSTPTAIELKTNALLFYSLDTALGRQGVIGSDYATTSATIVQHTGTTEGNLGAAFVTSDYTFYKNDTHLRLRYILQDSGAGGTATFRFKIGTTTLQTFTSNTLYYPIDIDIVRVSQTEFTFFFQSYTTGFSPVVATVNSTVSNTMASQSFVMTHQGSSAPNTGRRLFFDAKLI